MGVYGYMKILSPTPYFCVQAVFYGLLAALGGVWLWRHASRRTVTIAGLGLVFAALAILQSLYYSWTYDFQPQGRYLFPVLPILLLTWLSAAPPTRRRLVAALGGAAFLLGAASFAAVGLAYIPK